MAVAVTAALMAALLPTPAWAATPEAEREARAHFQTGESRFKAGAYDEALAEYQAGYEVLPLPGFLINVAQCQRRLGDLKSARATYQKFVLVAPDSPLVPQVKSMMAEIDGLLEKLETEKPSADANAKPPAVAPPAAVEPAAPAPVLVAAAPAPASETSAPGAPHRRWWLWGALGAIVVGGAVTAVVLASGGDATTIHDGSLATLRR